MKITKNKLVSIGCDGKCCYHCYFLRIEHGSFGDPFGVCSLYDDEILENWYGAEKIRSPHCIIDFGKGE